ncbi:hypothetical protein ED551_06590 [Muribaculaceae bacterium Isolate-013 (NCI)]|nr:hypothetical protein ED551_06590 [Muribaculaceae bacterium Isolate-013 (NCI)]
MPTIHLHECLNRRMAIHSYECDNPEETVIKVVFLRDFLLSSSPIYCKFFIPCVFCAILP